MEDKIITINKPRFEIQRIKPPYIHLTTNRRCGKTLYQQMLAEIYKDFLSYINDEIAYAMRCLDKVNQPFDIKRAAYINGEMCWCFIYPYDSQENLREINPMFCNGFKFILNSSIYNNECYWHIKKIENIDDLLSND